MQKAPQVIAALALAVALAAAAACSGGDPLVGLARGPGGDGPRVHWDPFAVPLPDIPFPNDIATRVDPSATTRRRLNATLEAPTSFERKLRKHLAELDGFGTFAPFWMRFDSPDPSRPELARLDLTRLAAVQRADTEFDDDAVLVIDVTRGSKTYGQAVVLDFGNGNFPLALQEAGDFFENDPRSQASNLLFDTYEEDVDGDGNFDTWEDTNQNGVLDPGEDIDGDGKLDLCEDTDSDGVFDHPNLWGTVLGDAERLHPYHDLMTMYELESDTLWFRPIFPLAESTTYAVVITRDVVGLGGDPVRSPFEYVHHLAQTDALRPLFEDGLLARYGRSGEDVAFAWSFTTQSVTAEMVALREGLHGYGKLAWLSSAYTPEVTDVVPMAEAEGVERYLLRPHQIVEVLRLVFEKLPIGGYDISRVQQLIDTYGAVDYMVAGDYTSPDLLEAADGVFALDVDAGSAAHKPASLRFVLVVPKEEYGPRPAPVALYCHGYTSLKLEALAFAGVLAKYGIATFAIDAPSHGLPIGGPEFEDVINVLLEDLGAKGLRPFFDAVRKDRARDFNNDSIYEVGGDFWTNDLFHTRDIVRQTVVDYMQAIRVFQGFDGKRLWAADIDGDGEANDLAGDFDGDGQVDVGGPGAVFHALGTSMGGINSTILGGIDPAIRAAAPVSPGGGLLEVGLRTDLGNVQRAVILPMFGPMVITEPKAADPRLTNVKWLVNDVFTKTIVPFATIGRIEGGEAVDELRAGDRFELENVRTGVTDVVIVGPDLKVRAHVAADRGDPIAVTVSRPDGTRYRRIETFEYEVDSFQGKRYAFDDPLVAIQEGLGYRRNTPSFRRLFGMAQMVLEPGDPVNYGAHYADPLEVRPEGASPTNLLLTLTMGDMTVPISTGVALGRAAGIIEYREPDPEYGKTQNQLLIDHHVVEAVDELHYFRDDLCRYHEGQVNFDIDDLSDGRHPSRLPRLKELVLSPACAAPNAPAACDSCRTYEPLRAYRETRNGIRAVRFPALRATGQHVVDLPDPDAEFDPSMFVLNQVGLFLGSGGLILSDHPCLAKNDCSTCAGEPDCPEIPPPTTMEGLEP